MSMTSNCARREEVAPLLKVASTLANEALPSIVEKVTMQSSEILTQTANLIDIAELERAITALSQADKIIFFGVGASGIAAMDADQKFLRINKNSRAFVDLHLGATAVVL